MFFVFFFSHCCHVAKKNCCWAEKPRRPAGDYRCWHNTNKVPQVMQPTGRALQQTPTASVYRGPDKYRLDYVDSLRLLFSHSKNIYIYIYIYGSFSSQRWLLGECHPHGFVSSPFFSPVSTVHFVDSSLCWQCLKDGGRGMRAAGGGGFYLQPTDVQKWCLGSGMCKWERLFSSRSASWRQTRQPTAAAEESETSSECVVQNSGLCTRRCWFVCLGGGALKMYEEVLFFSSFCWWVCFFFPWKDWERNEVPKGSFSITQWFPALGLLTLCTTLTYSSQCSLVLSPTCAAEWQWQHTPAWRLLEMRKEVSHPHPPSVFTVCDENNTPTQVLAPPLETNTCSTPVQQSKDTLFFFLKGRML